MDELEKLMDQVSKTLLALAIPVVIIWIVIASFTPTSRSGVTVNDAQKVLNAQQSVRSFLNYPDTAEFSVLNTKVNGETVSLEVTAKNGFGVPSTMTFRVDGSGNVTKTK